MIRIDRTVQFDPEEIRSIIDPNEGYRWVYYDPMGLAPAHKVRSRGQQPQATESEPLTGRILLACYEKGTKRPMVLDVRRFESTLWHRFLKDDPVDGLAVSKDAYGLPIVQRRFPTVAARRKWVYEWKKSEDYCSRQIVECRTPEDEFMQQVFWKEAQSESFNKGFQRIFFIDIETEISETSLQPFKARDRINMITVLDSRTDQFHTWSLKRCQCIDDGRHVVHDQFDDDESQMLRHFVNFWSTNLPDVVCGWNSRWYDLPYIIRRIENVLGSGAARKLSPVEDYQIVHEQDLSKRDEKGRPAQKEEIEWVDVKGLFQADDLLLYRDKFGVKQALDGGYGLSNVGRAEGLGSKVQYETTLKDLYNTDWQKFYEYNVRDVDLLHEIEMHCKLIPLARTVAGFGLANYDLIYQSTGYLVPTINIFALQNRPGMVFNTYPNRFVKKQPYEGAWVIPPTPGRYSHGIACADYNSLYPSAMQMMNLSPETYVGRIDDGYQGKGGLDNYWMSHGGIDGIPAEAKFKMVFDRCDMQTPVEQEIDVPTLKRLLDTRLIICPVNMTFFLKHEVKRGVLSDWAALFFARRKSTKKEMAKCQKEADSCTDPAQKEALLTRVENLNNLQYALKIALNSIYGALGTTGCPFLHPIGLAQSVTRAGRFCNTQGVRLYRQWLQENYHIGDDYVVVASGDTDSVSYDARIDIIEE